MKLDRRRFIRRAATTGLAVGAATCAPGGWSRVFAAPAGSKPIRICMLSGSEEYKSNESLAVFQQYLEQNRLAQCSRAFWTSKTNLPGLEALDSCDVMLLFTKRLELPPEQLDRVKDYCLAGRPIIGLRTASHAFQNWLELDREVLGGSYSGHYDSRSIKVTAEKREAKHPILNGFKPFETTSKLYKNPKLADDTTLLLSGAIPEHTEPLAWTREHRGGRVFYTSLGGPEEFGNDVFREMLVYAIYWAVKRSRHS
jgi:type 1 glutamine amidotransferase